MEHIYHIRYEYNEKEKSLRQIAKETGHDRKTISKYVGQIDFNLPKPKLSSRKKKTDQYKRLVIQWLKEDEKAPRKQRHSAHRIYDRLAEEELKAGRQIQVCERTIRNLVKELKLLLGQNKYVYLPLLHPPGEAQVDFGHTNFYEKGILYEGCHLVLAMPHSDAKFTQLFKSANSQCLEQGLMDIFNCMGKVPKSIRFDNDSLIVKEIKSGGEREIRDSFRRFQCHFNFDSNFCNPAAGHEKGSVENGVGMLRRNLFVPVPEMDDLEEYNKELLEICKSRLDRKHYKLEIKVIDLFAEDKEHMKELPAYAYEACRYVVARTNEYGMARYMTNSYSTSGNLHKCEVVLKVGAHKLEILR